MAQLKDLTAYRFGSALTPHTWTICGVQLRPFSLGHLIILDSVQNPFVASDAKSLSPDQAMYWFFSALVICAQSYEDNLKMLADDTLHKAIFKQFTKNLKKNMKQDTGWNLFSKIHLLKEYLNFYMEVPTYTEERDRQQKSISPSGNDWKLNLFLIFKKLGYTESEILNMNFRRLFYEWAVFAESEGAIKTFNKADLQMIAKAKGLI